MVFAWAVLLVGGLAVSVLASGRALHSAEALGVRAGLPPHIIGLTIVSIGTDLPEIANSIMASASGRGDVNVGDSTGSAATQITLVLGVVCLLRPLRVDRRFVAIAGALTVVAFIVGAWMMFDGALSRANGLILVLLWIGGTVLLHRDAVIPAVEQPPLFGPGIGMLAGRTLLALALVGGGAAAAVTAFGRLTDELGIPEYATSFLLLSLGTSLPELVVSSRAALKGLGAIALGNILGASLIDSTLSLGIGPLLFPTAVSDAAARGTLMVGGVVAVAILLLLRRRVHRLVTGIAAIALYLALFPIVIG